MVPVYFENPFGVTKIPGVGTISGKMLQSSPTMVPSWLYEQYQDCLIIAPITREYLMQLFGHRYFADTTFELNYLCYLEDEFLNKLAKKIGVSVKRTYTKKGKARKIIAKIKKEMGISGS